MSHFVLIPCIVLLLNALGVLSIGPLIHTYASNGIGTGKTATMKNDLDGKVYNCTADDRFLQAIQAIWQEYNITETETDESFYSGTPLAFEFMAGDGFAVDKPSNVTVGDVTVCKPLDQATIDKVEEMADCCGMTPGELCPKRAKSPSLHIIKKQF